MLSKASLVLLLAAIATAQLEDCSTITYDLLPDTEDTTCDNGMLPVQCNYDCSETPCSTKLYCPEIAIGDGAGSDNNAQSSFNKRAIDNAIEKDEVNARSFAIAPGLPPLDQFGRPLPGLCAMEKPFPRKCKPTRSTPFGEEPPYNIPYCQRIPCQKNNLPLDMNKRLCHSVPGCYFDYGLYYYRKFFKQLYPGVPVCHMAIRNKVFLKKARLASTWTSYFTKCLLDTFQEELDEKSVECHMLPLMRSLGHHPKMAGWKNIQKDECRIAVGACWEQGSGCFYPIKLNVFKVKSRQFAILDQKSRDAYMVYGRAKCQNFDTSNAATILQSIHICLASGCTVDIRVWRQYRDLMWWLGQKASPYAHRQLYKAFREGKCGSDNANMLLETYESAAPKRPSNPSPLFPFGNSMPSDPNAGMAPLDPNMGSVFPGTIDNSGTSFPGLGGINANSNNQDSFPSSLDCNIGERPCPPNNFQKYGLPGKYVFPRNCPYRPLPFELPGVKLTGSVQGCCDPPRLCYYPKQELFEANSGATTYYGDWDDWSTCSAKCGGGTQIRRRRCVAPGKSTADCTEPLREEKPCNLQPCPRWGPWGPYGQCSKQCGGGLKYRYRQCNSPSGDGCPNENGIGGVQSMECNTRYCG